MKMGQDFGQNLKRCKNSKISDQSQKMDETKKRKKQRQGRTQGKIDLRNESGRPMKVKVVGEVSEK